jgi:hypothetical protein
MSLVDPVMGLHVFWAEGQPTACDPMPVYGVCVAIQTDYQELFGQSPQLISVTTTAILPNVP